MLLFLHSVHFGQFSILDLAIHYQRTNFLVIRTGEQFEIRSCRINLDFFARDAFQRHSSWSLRMRNSILRIGCSDLTCRNMSISDRESVLVEMNSARRKKSSRLVTTTTIDSFQTKSDSSKRLRWLRCHNGVTLRWNLNWNPPLIEREHLAHVDYGRSRHWQRFAEFAVKIDRKTVQRTRLVNNGGRTRLEKCREPVAKASGKCPARKLEINQIWWSGKIDLRSRK